MTTCSMCGVYFSLAAVIFPWQGAWIPGGHVHLYFSSAVMSCAEFIMEPTFLNWFVIIFQP